MSCAGDQDVGLQFFGLKNDGCKDVSEDQSMRYSMMVSDLVSKGQNLALNITRVCRCSWNGCNGMADLINKDNSLAQNFATNNKETVLIYKLFRLLSIIMFIQITKI